MSEGDNVLSQYLFLLAKVKTNSPELGCSDWQPGGRNTYSFLRRSRLSISVGSSLGNFVAIPIPSCEGQDEEIADLWRDNAMYVAIPIPSCEGQDLLTLHSQLHLYVAIPIPSCEGQDQSIVY